VALVVHLVVATYRLAAVVVQAQMVILTSEVLEGFLALAQILAQPGLWVPLLVPEATHSLAALVKAA
jgi:hypothetical protein